MTLHEDGMSMGQNLIGSNSTSKQLKARGVREASMGIPEIDYAVVQLACR